MSLIGSLQSLAHDADVLLYELTNYDPNSSTEIFRFTNLVGVTFGGFKYEPIGCEIEGVQYTSEGAAARPKLRVADIAEDPNNPGSLLISNMIRLYDGLEGATLTIKKTLRTFLADGSTPDATAFMILDICMISHRSQEVPGEAVEFELTNPIDFVNEILPGRRAIPKCPWRYRGVECGYTGGGYTINNVPTSDPDLDICAKTVTACEVHFGTTATLNHGGYPSLQRMT
jgi:lambda family phage minor tail protein L